MNLFSELDAFERSPEYIGATPEIRSKSLDIWKAAAARKLIKAPDELPAAETVVEETLAQRKSRERSRLQPGEDGIIPPLAPSWDSVVSTPDYIEMKPEERAKAASVWADTAAAQRNGIRLNKTDRAAWLFERRLAETDAGSDLPVDRSTINTTDFLRPYEQAATAKAEKPVPNTGKVALVSAPDGTQSLDVHPTAALASEDEYYAMIDGIEGASPTAKMDAKAQYDVLRGAAKAKIQSKLAPTTTQLKLEEAKGGTMSALGTALRNAPGTIFGLVGAAMDTADTAGELSGTPEDAASRKIKSMASSVAGFRTTGASYAVTPSLIEDYKEDGASAIPLLSEDPKVRAAAEKQVLDELASNVLPGIDPELAAAAKNPDSSQAKELINTVRDNMLSQLWVDPEDAQEYPFEQLRVLSDGTPAWNPKFVESLSKADIAAVVDKAGLTGEARDTAITAGIQARNASSEDAVSDIRLMGRPYQEGFGQGVTLDFLSEQDSSYRNFVLDRVESEDFKSGRIDAADIIAEWKKQNTGFTRVAKAAINRALGAVPAFGKQLSIIAAGGTAAAADLAGIKTPELDQWIADNVQINSVLQQAAAGAETTWWQKTAGQLGKEVPFLLIGAAAARAGAAGAAAATDAAIATKAAAVRGVATAAGRAVEGRMITRAAGLGKQALASVQSLMNGTSLASRTYFGMQAGRSAGDMYTSVYGQLLEQGKAAGMSEQAARENARTGAIIPSIVAAGVTGTLMKLMPGGTERLVGMAAGRAPTLGKLAEVFGKTKLGQALANAEWKSTYAKALTSVFAGIGKEAAEESIDEFVQTVIRAGYDDSLRLDDMLTAAGEAGLIGGIMGGASGAFEAGVDIRLANQEKRSLALAEQRRIQQEAAAKKARMSDVLDELDRVGAAETKGAVEATLEEEAAAQIAMEKSAFSAVFLNQIPTEDDGSGEEQPVMYESDTEYATEGAARARVTEIQTFFSDVASRRANHPVTRFELGVEKGAGGWRVTALYDPAAVAEAAATPPDAGAAPPAAPVVDPNASPVVQAFNAAVATAKAPPKKFEDLKSDWERLANEYHTSTPDTRRPELSDDLEAATKALNSPRTAKQRGGVKAVNPELLDLQKEVPGTLLPEGVSEVRRKGRKDTRPFIQKANSQYKGLPADTVKRAKLKTKLHAALTAFSAAPDADKADRVAALTKELDNAGVRASISNAVQKELEQAAARANTAPAPESKAPKAAPAAAPAAEPAPVVIDVQAEVVPVEAAPVVEAPVAETPAEAPVVETPAEAPPAEAPPAEPAAPPEVVVDFNAVQDRIKAAGKGWRDKGLLPDLNLPLPGWVDEGYTPAELGAAIDDMFGNTETDPRPFGIYNGARSLAGQNSRAVAYNAMTPAMKEAFKAENEERILAEIEQEARDAENSAETARSARDAVFDDLGKNQKALDAIEAALSPLKEEQRRAFLESRKEDAATAEKKATSAERKADTAEKKAADAEKKAQSRKATQKIKTAAETAREEASKARDAADAAREEAAKARKVVDALAAAREKAARKKPTVTSLLTFFADDLARLYTSLANPPGVEASVMDQLQEVAVADFGTWAMLRTLYDSEVEGMKQLAGSLMEGYLKAFQDAGRRRKTANRKASEVFKGEVSGVRVFGKKAAPEAVQILVNSAMRYAERRSGRVFQKENTVSLDAQVGDRLNAEVAAEEGRTFTGGDTGELANQPVEDSGDAQPRSSLGDEKALQTSDSYAGDGTRADASPVFDWANKEIETRADATDWLERQKTVNPSGYEKVKEDLDQFESELQIIAASSDSDRRKSAALLDLMGSFNDAHVDSFSTRTEAAKTHVAKLLLIRAGVGRAMGKPELVKSRATQKAVKKEDRATLTEQQKLTEKRISAELKNLGAVDGDPESLIIALTKISESSEYPAHLSASARFLLDTGAINLIESFQIVNDPGMDSAGHYDSNTGAVVINTANPNPRGAADVLVHEIFHPLWVEAITADHAPGSPEAEAADRFRAVYRDAKLTYMQRRSTIEALEKDIAELLVARMMLESPGGMRRALARAKAKGIEYAADYVTDLPLEEVRALYAAHLAESSGVTAALNLIEDFDYVFQAKETNGISREFATHLATDHNFQILIDRVLSPAGTNTATGRPIGWRPMLRALWSSGLSALNARAATVTAPSSRPMLFNDLRLLIGDAATSYTPMRSRPKIPVAVTFRKRAGIQAGITPAGTVIVTAGTGVQAPTLSVTPSAATASTSPAASVFNLAEPRPVTVETTPDGSVVMTAGAGAKAPTLSVAPVDVTSSVGAETTVFSLMQPLVTAAPGIDQAAAAEAVASVEPNAEVRAEIEVDPEIAPDPIMDVLMQEDVTVANLDDLEKALRVSIERKNASTLELKRSLKIGYARGVRLSNILEQLGVFSPVSPANRRNLLVADINSPEAVAILEGIAAAREAKTNPVKQDATQERNLTEGDLGQYQEGDQTGTPAEAGRGDGAAAGGQVKVEIEPDKSRPASTRRQFLGSMSALAAALSIPGCNMQTLEQRIAEVVRMVGDDVTPATTVERIRQLAAAGTEAEVDMADGLTRGLQLFDRQINRIAETYPADKPIKTNIVRAGGAFQTITAREAAEESARIIDVLSSRLPEVQTALRRIAGIMQDITGVDMSGARIGLFTEADSDMAVMAATMKGSRLYGAQIGEDSVARFHPGTLAGLVSDSVADRLKSAATVANEFTHIAQRRKSGNVEIDAPVFAAPAVELPKLVSESYKVRIAEDYRGTRHPRMEAESFDLAWLSAKAFAGSADRVATLPEVTAFVSSAANSFVDPKTTAPENIFKRVPSRISGSEVLFSRSIRKADGAAARAYAEGQNVRIAVSPGLADRMNSRSMSDTDRRILRSAIDEAQVLAAEIFYEGAPEEGYIDNGVMMSRSTKNQSFRTAPDWFKRYMSTAGVLGMDPEEADAWAEFAYPLFLEAPAEWTSSASPDEIAMMTWLLNRKVRVATAAGGKKAKDELPDLMDQIRTLGGLSQINPGGEDHQQLYSMQTTFDTAFHKPLQALKKIGVSRSSRVAGTDGIFTPGAVRVDGAYTAITSAMDAAYRLLPPATADRSLWFAAVMADERFETMVAATKTPGLPEALRNFRTEVRAKYPVISTDDTGKLTGMTAMMQDIDSVIRDLAGIGATLDPDAISKRLDSIVSRLGADPKMKAKAMNIMFGQTPVTSSELRGIALMTLQVDITSVLREKAMSAKKEKGALRFLGAGAEAFAFSDDAQGIIYKIILPRFSGTSVGFSFDLPAPNRTGSAAGAFIPSATAATIGRSPLRQMLVEEHTAVPGLVDSEVVAMTAFGAVVTAQKALGGEEFGMEQHGGQALLWSQTHNASFFDATKLTTRFGGNVVRDAVLIRDALGEFRVLLDFRDTNVFAAGPILAPFDVMVSAPVPPAAMESQILSRAAEDIMRSRKASKLTDRVRGFLIAGKPGSFAEEISKGDPNEVLDLARFAGLSRYGKFGKAFAQTKQDFDYRIRAVRKTAINMLEELGTVVKGATDDQYKWVNLMLGSQDNMYDEAMHRLATTAYRRARLGATRRYRSARRRAAAFAGLPEEAQMIAEANTAFETDMRDATNTFRAELDAALDAGILAFKIKQDDARRLLQASPGGDRMYRTAAALRQELDRLGSEMLKHTDLDPRVRAIISRNNGVYLTRTYQMHDDPNYAAMVLSADPVMQKRVAAALDEFRLSTRQGYINRLMATLPPGTASLTAARAAADRWMTTTGESIAKHALTDFLTTQQEISRGSGAAGTLNRGILTEKTDLPPALRELLGQTSDNITAAARSIHEIGRYNATHEFQTNIFTALDDAEKDRQSELARLRALGAAISPEDAEKLDKLDSVMYMTKNREEALRHKLMPFARASEKVQTQAYGPLQDVYGPSILVEAVHSLEPEELSGMMAALQTLTARSQMNLTVLSPKAQIRNVLANPGWYIAAGHYQIWRMKWKPRVMAALAAAGTDRKTADNRMREFYAQYGITGGSPLSAVMDTIAESGYSNIEDTLDRLYQSAAARAAAKVGNKIEAGLQKIEDYAKEKYEAGDDFFKIAIFEAELADYMKSFGVPDQSDGSIVVSDPVTADRIIAAFASNKRIPPVRLRELSGSRTELAREYLIREAAASTRDSIAYYDQLPPVIEGLKRNLGVAVAPFLSYRIAMPMAIIGSLKRAAADFQRPETRAKGLRRIAGTTFLFLGFNWAMSYAVKLAYALGSAAIGALFGDDEDKKKQLPNGVSASDSDRDKGLRDLLGEWYRNRSVSYLGTAPNGDIIYSDISWLNPTSSLRDVFVPLLANWSRTTRSWEDFGAAARETVSRVAEPFIAPQVTIADVVMAATADNFDAQTRTPLEKAGAAMQAFASAALVPGGINDLLRVYDARKTTKFWQELGSYSTGLRIKTLNVNDAVTNNLRTTKKKLEAAAADLRKLRYAEKPTDSQITEEYAKVMDRYRQSLQVSRDAVESARLFIPYDTIRSILRDGEHGISRKNTLGIERGLVPVYTLPDTVVAEMRKADVKNGTTRTDAYRRAVAAQQPLKLY